MVWQELSEGKWEVVHKHSAHSMPVTCISWGPSEYGLEFACGSSDGFISVAMHYGIICAYTNPTVV